MRDLPSTSARLIRCPRCGYDISGRTNFGSVAEKPIKEIWQGPEFTWWRTMHLERRGGEIPMCRECPDWRYRSWKHNWQKVLRKADAKRLKALEAENARLKKVLAESLLEVEVTREVLQKKW